MGSLVECGLANALVAAMLALAALAAGRYSRRPALVHALWALVLLKLITPPVIPLPVPLPLPEPRAERPASEEEAPPPRPSELELAAAQPRPEPAPQPAPSLPPGMKIEELVPELMKMARGEAPMRLFLPPPPPAPTPVVAREAPPLPVQPEPAGGPPPHARPRPAPRPRGPSWEEVASFLGWAWVAGAAACFALALWRIACFQRMLRHARPAPKGLQRQGDELAAQLGLGRCPPIALLPGPVPPLLWAATGRARLFFPATLLPRLDEAGRAALLTHELAHLARRDHWVRWLELLAGCAYWWYPLVWLARSRMQAAEEECCDAWVVSSLPGHGPAYAGALLETVDFLSRRPAPLPPTASGFGRVHRLKRRLIMIVQGSTPRNLSLAGKALVLALAAALPMTPGRARPADAPASEAGKPADKTRSNAPARPADGPAAEALPDEPDRYATNSRALAGAGGQVWQAAVSPDGKTLAVVCGGTDGEGALTLWGLPTGKEVVTVTEAKPIRTVAFSPDGKVLATGEFDNAVKLRDPKTGAVKKTLKGHTAGVNAVAFTPDSKVVISGSLDKTVRFWSVASGKSTRALPAHPDLVQALAVSPDGKALVCAGRDGQGHVYDLPTGKRRHVIKLHTAWVEGVAIAPDNDTVATVSHDRTVKLWSASTGKVKSTLLAHDDIITAALFLEGGKELATAASDRTVKIWDVKSGGLTAAMANAHTDRIPALAVTPDGKTLVTGSWDRTVKLWDAQSREEQKKLQPRRYAPENNFPLLALAVSPDGTTLAVGGEERAAKLIDAATGRLKHLLHGHEDVVGGVAFSPDGKLVATAGFDGDVRLWSAATGKPVRVLKGHVNWVFCIAFSPDGKQLASGGYDKTIRLWDVEKGAEIARLNKHKGGVRAIAYSPDGTRLASAGTDRAVRVWDVARREAVHLLRGHEDVVRSLAFSPDGRRLVSGSEDMTIRLWDVPGEKQVTSYRMNTAVRAVAWSPRGATIAVGGADRSLRVLDPRNLGVRMTGTAHANAVTAVAYAPDSSKLFTASEDQSVRAWDGQLPTRRPVASFPSSAGARKFARFSPDGKWLAMGGDDKGLEVRDARFGRAESVLTGGLGQSVMGAAVSADGKLLAVSCMDSNVRLYELPSVKFKGLLAGHTQRAWAVAFSPDDKMIVSGAGSWEEPLSDGEVKVWDVATMKPVASLGDTPASVQAVAWSSDGKHIAVGSRDGVARVFDASTRKLRLTLKGHKAEVRRVAFSPDARHLLTAATADDPTARVWSVADGAELAVLKAPDGGIGGAAWSPDGKWLALGSKPSVMNGYAQLWEVTAGEQGKLSFKEGRALRGGLAGYGLSVAFSPDSKTLALGGGVTTQSGDLGLFDVATGRLLANLHGHANWVEAVVFTPDGKSLISGGGFNNQPGELRVWNVNRAGWAVPNAHTQSAFCAVWAPDGKALITGSYDATIKFWDAATGKLKASFESGQEGVRALAITRDGKMLASGGHDRTVRLWDLTDDKEATELARFDKVVSGVAFSPDGKLLAACCADPYQRDQAGAVKVVEVDTGRERPGEWKSRAAMSVAFSPDGKALATGSLGPQGIILYDVAGGKQTRVVAGSAGVFALEYSQDGRRLASAHNTGTVAVRDTKTWAPPVLCTGHTDLCPALSLSPDALTVASASHDRTAKLFDLRRRDPPASPGPQSTARK